MPQVALSNWLLDRGIDWNPFEPDEVRIVLMRTTGPECWCVISVAPGALLRLGLHPDQGWDGPPARWWHR